tara:strand:- start:156 stop:437 length:282 start_codon:yes stop_codon:yes gene_type:complete
LRNKERLMGFAMGMVLTLLGMSIFTLLFSDQTIWGSLQILYIEKKLGSLISLGALLNLPMFFVFIKQHRYHRAYGLLIFLLLLVLIIASIKMN